MTTAGMGSHGSARRHHTRGRRERRIPPLAAPPSAAYRFLGQMKVLQLANNVRELSPMNSVAE
jgi:hypothetical protein